MKYVVIKPDLENSFIDQQFSNAIDSTFDETENEILLFHNYFRENWFYMHAYVHL